MVQPAYIITPYYYRNSAVDDVQDILDDLGTLLPANGWSNPATDTYQTPADPWGRYFKVAFVRTSATRLSVTMTDDQARATQTRCFDISGTVAVEYFYGARYLHVYNLNGGEGAYASLLSVDPESETSHNKYCAFFASRNSTGTLQSNDAGAGVTVNSSTNAYDTTPDGRFMQLNVRGTGGNTSIVSSYSGGRRWYPCWSYGNGTEYKLRGRLYNALFLPSALTSSGSEDVVPIDEATTGVFKTTCLAASPASHKMAMRKA